MELVASLPPDLAALADPTARAAAPPLRRTDQDTAAAAAAGPFDLLLALLTAPLPGGESLPAGGNALPAATAEGACDLTSPSGAFARPVAASALTGADLLARLKLAATPVADDGSTALPAQATDADANTSLPFADLDLPQAPELAATKPVAAAPAPPVASQASADVGPDVAAALQAALPPQDAAPKSPRAGPARTGEQAVARPSAEAVATDLGAEQAIPAAPTPVGEIADAGPRSAHRDTPFETFALSAASADSAAAPGAPAPSLAPAQPHAATAPATAPAVDASTLPGHGAAIDTRADNWHEALASRVQVLVDQHVGEAHIKLNPPELGAVDIKISLVDDKTFVQLTAGTSAARDELTQSLPKLRELLSASGLSLGGASVHGGAAGQGGHETAPRVVVPAYAPFAGSDDVELEPLRTTPRGMGRIDLFA